MKSLNFTLIILAASALFMTASAQLNGTYTIGGTTPDYATIQAAVTALQTAGVNGPVIFNIRPGTYNEKVDIGNVPGTSAVNTVTIKSENGDSTSVIVSDSASATTSNFTFHIYGTDFLTIRNLTIRRVGNDDKSCVFSIALNSRYLQIRNNIIQSDNTTTLDESAALINFPLAGANDSSVIFSNNIFNNGSYGIKIQGQSAISQIPLTQITNNVFRNQTSNAIDLSLVSASNIQGNNISTNTTSFGYNGINIANASQDFKIVANKISGIKNGDAISLGNCDGTSGARALIANNFLETEGTGTCNGISVFNCSAINFFYNTINITSLNASSAAMYLNNSNDSLLNIKNNIFVNTGNGYTYNLISNSINSIVSSDYNDFYVNPSSTIFAFFNTGTVGNFADWKTASSMDSHSVSGDPQFISQTDLHVGNPIVNNAGVFVSGVTTDIDGQTRSNTTPDIGADEFVPLTNNVGIVGFVSPETRTCGDSSMVIAIVIHNYGLNNQTSFPMHAEVTGAVTQSITQNYSGSLGSNAIDTVLFTQFVNTYAGGIVNISAYLSLAGDQYRFNDTITNAFEFDGHPNAPVVVSPQQQCDNNIQISATPDSGDVLAWYAEPSGGDPLFVGNDFSPTISGDTTFYVESRKGAGFGGCLRITEIQPNDNPSDFIEVTNLSGVGFDATGWKVIASSFNNVPLDSTWNLGYFNPGETKFRTDDFADTNYFGDNLPWSGGSGGWAMIIDDHQNIADFVIWDWTNTSFPISTMVITVDGVDYNVGSELEWTGPSYTSCVTPDDNQRIGSGDNNNASDWSCASITPGTHNSNLSNVFNNCGIGECGSPRLPVDVTLVPGVTVNLGNDTLIGQPFSINLDAGPGFNSYLWSTGDTVQTITATTYDIYWVTVTGGTNNCSFTDSINISLNVGINNLIGPDEINLYPNPSSDKLAITARGNILKNATINVRDIQGRLVDIPGLSETGGELYLDLNNLDEGVYFLHVISGNRTGVKRFVVIK